MTLKGELDLSVTDAIESDVKGNVADANVMVVDLGAVTFVDSTGLRLLIGFKQGAEDRGGKFLLARVSRPAQRLFAVAGLDEWFEYVDGHAPPRVYCPVCEREIPVDSERCPKCGSAF